MRVCVVSFKECWEQAGEWYSYGGFPMQMAAIGSLFDEMTLVIVRGAPRAGGMPLPPAAKVVPMRAPRGADLRRKVSVVTRLPHYLRVMGREMRSADVVHTPVPGDLPLISLVLASALGKRIIARYGSSWVPTTETTMMNRVTKALMRGLAGGRNVMLATGDGDTNPAARMHWLFATAVSRAEVQAVQPRLDRPAGQPVQLAYVGRLSPEKGVRFLIEAIALVQSHRGPAGMPVFLTLIGDGPERASLERLTHVRGCADAIAFAGQLTRAALLQRLEAVDACVLPSLTESFCKARLDAMLCGVPVVTTPVGFGRDIVGDDGERGWIVAEGDAPALAAALERLAAEPRDWPALRRRCRAYVESRTLEAWVDRIGLICSAQWNMHLVGGKLRA